MYSPSFMPILRKITLKPHYSRWLLLIWATCFLLKTVSAQKFSSNTIPDSLKENADAVVRLEEISWEIKSPESAVLKKHSVYTILNEKGDGYAVYHSVYNNKSITITSISGYLYDGNGREIRHFKKKDMEDFPYEDGVSFINDERLKREQLSCSNYPYTVEFEEEDEYHGFVGIGGWKPQHSISTSVELSKYSITAPDDYRINYRMLNADIQPLMEEKNNRKSYIWKVSNLVAYEEVYFSADYASNSPKLLLSLGQINMEGFKGDMTTWTGFGKFYGSLQKGRDVLPDDTKQKVHELTKNISDPKAKVTVLYNYLQQNSHYINVQLGIGGLQASEASYVAIKKYGDCKALSNFMISLLKEAGIKANAVVIKGGERDLDFVSDFAYDPFNHVICCVPIEKDTIWLECTDQFLPAGYLSDFTSNRYGLLVEDDGGRLVHTPAYLIKDNIRNRKINAKLDVDGGLIADSRTSYQAFCQDRIEKMIHHYSGEEQLKILKSKFNLPTYDILSFKYDEDYSDKLPIIKESLQMNIKDYAQITGKRIFLNPNILSRSLIKLSEDKNRRLDIELKDEYHYLDTVQITIPSGYALESRPVNLNVKNKYGRYSGRVILDGNQVTYYREQEQYSGCFPAKEYGEVVKFYQEMYDADHRSIVLVKSN